MVPLKDEENVPSYAVGMLMHSRVLVAMWVSRAADFVGAWRRYGRCWVKGKSGGDGLAAVRV